MAYMTLPYLFVVFSSVFYTHLIFTILERTHNTIIIWLANMGLIPTITS